MSVWRIDGGWRRARLDVLAMHRTLIIGYRLTDGDVGSASCERRIAADSLDIEAAAHIEAVETLHPELKGKVRFLFQWQEANPPYALSPPILMSDSYLDLGRQRWREAGALWDAAVREHSFPSYSPQHVLACPSAEAEQADKGAQRAS